ncbi:acetylornithine/succinylornithine aminotransferase [Methylophilaceae bacterium 11]|jgi:acetylornithine aminotransferase|uniref:aspartate aminotransferase family protein n=1 Tax=unclassified Methylotenera TaxID=2643294 RepID=UPI000378EEBA|nr:MULTISPECIES: aspartate aminotransferase family protein [unclassified Methylotenera]EUJ10217.1 acetylornithine/succinylornithine aminotransferase [Methylophilaceae bacterium 11]
MSEHLMNTYGRQPVSFDKGVGVWLYDQQGNAYLDGLSGVAVNGLGHAHPKFVAAIQAQVARLVHVSNIYQIAEQARLADKLAEISGMDKVFFCNSGCEANEAAIKLARLYGHNKGIENPEIIVMERAFHGRTMATLSATGNRKTQAGFEPLVSGFVRVPFDDLEAVKQVAKRKNNVVAILVEPVQGEGGVHIPADLKAYFQGLRQVCDENGWLLMLDEVQSGVGRTGTWFAFQHTGIMPDVMTLAKGLGSGVPIGACLAKGAAADTFTPGKHGSTFGGNPLATAAGIATLDIIAEEKLRENAEVIGAFLNTQIAEAFAGNKHVVNVRNAGLMVGIELDVPCGELVKLALEQKLLINVTAEKVIRLLPSLIMSKQEAQELVNRLVPIVKTFLLSAEKPEIK